MVADSFGEENYQIFQRGDVLTVVFHEDYHADGPKPNNAYRTFTFDMAGAAHGCGLADLLKPGPDRWSRSRRWASRSSRTRSNRRRRRTSRAAIRSWWTGGRPTRCTPAGTGPGR